MDGNRDELNEMAQLAEQAERYPNMAEYMKTLVEKYSPLETEERNRLSVAYKNVVGALRSAWRVLSSIESKNPDRCVIDYKGKISEELRETCLEVLMLLNTHLIKEQDEVESKVFYLKMKGDYHRYLAEVADEDKKQENIDDSNAAYQAAFDVSKDQLQATHPTRLGLALNFSVFYYEIANSPEQACTLAQEAFDEAMSEIEKSPAETFKDSNLILHLLRDNLTLWKSETQGDALEGEQEAN